METALSKMPWPKWYRPPVKPLRIDSMVMAACEAYCITKAEFKGSGRVSEFVRPRQAVCYVLRTRRTDMSFPQIARVVGKKDHSTVIHAVQQARKLRLTDMRFAALCDHLELLA